MTAQEKLLDFCHDLTGDVTGRGGRVFVPLRGLSWYNQPQKFYAM